MGGKASRDKGARFERKIVNLLRDVLPDGFEAHRNLQPQSGKAVGSDVSIRRGLTTVVSIECKHQKSINYTAAMEQAEKDALIGSIPVVVAKKHVNGRTDKTHVLMSFDSFVLLLLRALEE